LHRRGSFAPRPQTFQTTVLDLHLPPRSQGCDRMRPVLSALLADRKRVEATHRLACCLPIHNRWIAVQIPAEYGKPRRSDAGLQLHGSLPCISFYSHAAFTRWPPCTWPPGRRMLVRTHPGIIPYPATACVAAFSEQLRRAPALCVGTHFHSGTCSTSLSRVLRKKIPTQFGN
jgi:hypothetical protein